MNVFKLRVMVREFPFLKEILEKKESDITELITSDDKEVIDEVARLSLPGWYEIVDFEERTKVRYLENPASILVKRADENLLNQTPLFDSYSWMYGGYTNYIAYYAVCVGGVVHEFDSAGRSETASGENTKQTAQSIGEQLYERGLNPEYIVCVDFRDLDVNGNGEEIKTITIYKVWSFDLVDYYCRQIDKAANELKAEIRMACSK